MENLKSIEAICARQRAYFESGRTLPLSARRAALRLLRCWIERHEELIYAALHRDLNKSKTESFLCEVGMTLSALSYAEGHLEEWVRPRVVPTPLAQFPSKSYTVAQPYGLALIISPWNYPFLLSVEPLIGAIAAGNCCILKPSPDAPATAAVLNKLASDCFAPEHVTVVRGGVEVSEALLAQKFDKIFFTGSVPVGKKVMEAAARHLTPVTLELGGKSPCIVTASADLNLAAKRIVFGKLLNCGQTCVAPDYVLIDEGVKDAFLPLLQKWVRRMYGKNALDNAGYVRMVNRRHFERLCALIDPEKVAFGGKSDPQTLKIQPTVLDNVSPEDAVMQEEIFGPVLPVLTYGHIEEAEAFVRARPHPLALYLFTENEAEKERFTCGQQFGGGCINDTVIHLASDHLPFGGVGESGMGSYHGKNSFEAFSHQAAIVDKSTRLDLPFRYAPYGAAAKKILHLFLR